MSRRRAWMRTRKIHEREVGTNTPFGAVNCRPNPATPPTLKNPQRVQSGDCQCAQFLRVFPHGSVLEPTPPATPPSARN
jgi:hypothetical protein